MLLRPIFKVEGRIETTEITSIKLQSYSDPTGQVYEAGFVKAEQVKSSLFLQGAATVQGVGVVAGAKHELSVGSIAVQ